MSTQEDNFTYWRRLEEEGKKIIDRIVGIVYEFVGILRRIGIPYVEPHFFPFDTRSVSIIFGEHPNMHSRYFSLSLEDINLNVQKKEVVLTIRTVRLSSWIGGRDQMPREGLVTHELDKYRNLSVHLDQLLTKLAEIYNSVRTHEICSFLPPIS
ncbi:MAG: hypothetical protein ABDH32_07000 [Candidatus Caldarchaeales archaeon]